MPIPFDTIIKDIDESFRLEVAGLEGLNQHDKDIREQCFFLQVEANDFLTLEREHRESNEQSVRDFDEINLRAMHRNRCTPFQPIFLHDIE
jgi:hypothetical protein